MKYQREVIGGSLIGSLLLLLLIGVSSEWFSGVYQTLAVYLFGFLLFGLIVFLVFRFQGFSFLPSKRVSSLGVELSNNDCRRISQRLLTFHYGFFPDEGKSESSKMVYNVPDPVFVRRCSDRFEDRTAWVAVKLSNRFSDSGLVPDFVSVIIDPESTEELVQELANFSGFKQYNREVSKVVVDEFGIPVSETKIRSSEEKSGDGGFNIDLSNDGVAGDD